MDKKSIIETKRLVLRHWLESDVEPFIVMNSDPEVMRHFPAPSSAEQTRQFYDVIQQEFSENGYGLYVVEEKASGAFVGFTGFHWATLDLEFCPCAEIGWRLAHRHWGKGYATEAAKACLDYGFTQLGFDKVCGFTNLANTASQRVMQKIGMTKARIFERPSSENHPQRTQGPQVCYMIVAPSGKEERHK